MIQVHVLESVQALPVYATSGSSGADLTASVDTVIFPGQWEAVPTGLVLEIPSGYEGQVRPRSGVALRHGVTVLNAPGTIDSDYRGEIKVILINHSDSPFVIKKGDRIAQLVFCPVVQADCFIKEVQVRGVGGFGSTGGVSADHIRSNN